MLQYKIQDKSNYPVFQKCYWPVAGVSVLAGGTVVAGASVFVVEPLLVGVSVVIVLFDGVLGLLISVEVLLLEL